MKIEVPLAKTKSSQTYVKSSLDVVYYLLKQLVNNNLNVICIDDKGNEIKTKILDVRIEAYKVWIKLNTSTKCEKLIIELR